MLSFLGLPDLGAAPICPLTAVRFRKFMMVDQGRPEILDIAAIVYWRWKRTRIIPRPTTVISRRTGGGIVVAICCLTPVAQSPNLHLFPAPSDVSPRLLPTDCRIYWRLCVVQVATRVAENKRSDYDGALSPREKCRYEECVCDQFTWFKQLDYPIDPEGECYIEQSLHQSDPHLSGLHTLNYLDTINTWTKSSLTWTMNSLIWSRSSLLYGCGAGWTKEFVLEFMWWRAGAHTSFQQDLCWGSKMRYGFAKRTTKLSFKLVRTRTRFWFENPNELLYQYH